MEFTGFTEETLAWFDGLERNNSKAYFNEHRAIYEHAVRGPLTMLLTELSEEFGGTPQVFRPNRDVRFSRDKAPYKTIASGLLVDRAQSADMLYAQISSEGLLAATGYYNIATDQLARYRAALATDDKHLENGAALTKILQDIASAGYEIGGERLKTLPRGVARNAANADLLKYKWLTAGGYLPPEVLISGRTPLIYTAKVWRETEPLLAWLDRHVGASQLPKEAR